MLTDTSPACKQCGCELEGTEATCPQCGFRPRKQGLRVSLGLLGAVVVLMSVTMVVPPLGPLLVRLAALAFLLTLVLFVFAFVVTPYRLSSPFAWFYAGRETN